MHRKSFPLLLALMLLAGISRAQDSIDSLIPAVTGADKDAAIQAIDSLSHHGAKAKAASAALAEALGGGDADVAWHAARALGAIGPDANSAVPTLTACLGSEDARIRAYSAFALGRIGVESEEGIQVLVDRIFDEDEMVRRASIRALRSIDPPEEIMRPMMLKILEEGEPSMVMPALASLAEDGKEAVPRLREALKHEKACYWACIVLSEIGPDAAEAMPELLEVLKSDEPDTRLHAVLAIGEIGPAAKNAVPALIDMLNNAPFDETRHAAAYALGKIEAKSDEVNEALVAAARGEDAFLEQIACWALALVNPDRADVVEYCAKTLIEGLQSDNEHIRSAAARGLAFFGDHSDIVGPALVEALKDANPIVIGNALDALAAMGPKMVERVGSALQNKELRHLAVRIIYRVGPEATSAVVPMIEALQTPPETPDDVIFHRELQIALGQIGPGAKDAVPALIESLASDEVDVRGSACYALGKIGADATAAVPALRKGLETADKTKLGHIWALLQIQPGDEELEQMAIPVLIEGLSDEFEVIREESAEALGKLGAKAAAAVEPLKKLAEDDPVFVVRQAAAEALDNISGPAGS